MISCRKHLSLLLLIWFFWPLAAPFLLYRSANNHFSHAFIVFADDPFRTQAALSLWQSHSSSMIWVLGDRSLQLATLKQLELAHISPQPGTYRSFLGGKDTVGQLTGLSHGLPRNLTSVTIVTDQAHRNRAFAIALFALGSQGIYVDVPAIEDLPPMRLPYKHDEGLGRLIRDILRVQFWRLTGSDGRFLVDPTL